VRERNGSAVAPPQIACSIGVSTSRKPRASSQRRIALTARAAATQALKYVAVDDHVHVALAGSAGRCCRSAPCHFSGSVSTILLKSVHSVTASDTCPVRVFITVPAPPTMSPRSSSLERAATLLAQRVELEVELQLAGLVQQVAEAGLAYARAARVDPPGQRHFLAFQRLELRLHLRRMVRAVISALGRMGRARPACKSGVSLSSLTCRSSGSTPLGPLVNSGCSCCSSHVMLRQVGRRVLPRVPK